MKERVAPGWLGFARKEFDGVLGPKGKSDLWIGSEDHNNPAPLDEDVQRFYQARLTYLQLIAMGSLHAVLLRILAEIKELQREDEAELEEFDGGEVEDSGATAPSSPAPQIQTQSLPPSQQLLNPDGSEVRNG